MGNIFCAPQQPTKTFVVVGAGMGGLAFARIVAKNKNVRVEVVERRADAMEQKGSAYGLAKNGQKAMEVISPSILKHCKKVGIKLYQGILLLPWFEIREQLWNECQRMRNVNIRTGLTASEFEETEDGVVVKFSNSDLELKGDVLIGADGLRSTIRDLLELPKAQPNSLNSQMWRGSFSTLKKGSKLDHLHSTFVSGPMQTYKVGDTLVFLFSFNEQTRGLLTWVVASTQANIQKDTSPWELIQREEDFPFTPPKQLELLKQVFAESSDRDLQWHTPVCVTPVSSSSTFTKGRVALIGDAAHAIVPADGLGGALAFEDVVVLSRLLEKDDFDDIRDVLKEYEKKRVPRVALIAAEQMERAKVYRKAGRTGAAPWDEEYKEWINMGHEAPSHFVSSADCDPLVINCDEEKKEHEVIYRRVSAIL